MTLVLIVGLLMNAVALPLAAQRASASSSARSATASPRPTASRASPAASAPPLKRQVVEVFGQKKLLKWSIPGTAHFFVMWAFLILGTVYLEAYAVAALARPRSGTGSSSATGRCSASCRTSSR